MTEITRETILASIRYEPLSCPDAGDIPMLPYISGKAMDQMSPESEDSKTQFEDFYNASRHDQSQEFSSLSEDDVRAIAEHYCGEKDCLAEFREAASRRDSNVYDAFRDAFCSTESWKQWDRDRKRLIQQIHLNSKMWRIGIERQISDAMKVVRQIERIRVPTIPAIDLADWVSQRRLLHENALSQIQPNVLASAQLQKSLEAAFKQWKAVSIDVPQMVIPRPAINLRLGELTSMVKRSQEVVKILQSTNGIHDAIAKTMSLSKMGLGQIDGIGPSIAESLRLTNEMVTESNRHFSAPLRPRIVAQPIYPNTAVEQLDADRQVEDFYEQSEIELYNDTSDAVTLTNDTLLLLKDQFGELIKDQLSPYSDVLNRLAYLSKPKSFIEVLRQFAAGFGNQHWKSLWETLGNKFKPRPEQIAQSILASFVEGKCSGVAFVGRELGSGAGFVDLLVSFLGYSYLVEIKIVGGTWGIGAAKDGLDQLDSYMTTYDQSKAYLVVFDGRKTAKGEQLDDAYQMQSGVVEVVVVRSYFDAPTT